MTDPNATPTSAITINEIYKEQYAHFRGLNDILYKIPPLFTAVIGALWYFAVQKIDDYGPIAATVFAFTAVASVSFVNVMSRFRAAFNGYIDNLNKMDGDMKVSIASTSLPSTITIIQFLLWVACLVSIGGIAYVAYRAGITFTGLKAH